MPLILVLIIVFQIISFSGLTDRNKSKNIHSHKNINLEVKNHKKGITISDSTQHTDYQ